VLSHLVLWLVTGGADEAPPLAMALSPSQSLELTES
jgi:hypothetical protein